MTDYTNLQDLLKSAGIDYAPKPVVIETRPVTAETRPVASPPISLRSASTKRRFLLVGTHGHQTTGYSKVTYHIVQELAKSPDIEVYHFGFQKFMVAPPEYRPYPHGVDVYDPVVVEKSGAAPQEMGFGFSQLAAYVRKVKPDVMMIYNDAGIICRFLDKLKEELTPAEKSYKLLIYLDQVYTIQRPELLARMDLDADAYFAFTEYWKGILAGQGIKKPIHVLRHGFDPAQFKPLDRATIRKKHNIPENLFVFLNLNRNTPRKRYDLVVTAFAELVARHPTKPLALMCVCDNGETGGFSIQEIYLRELDKRRVPIQFHSHKLMVSKQALTYTDEMVNELYAMADVGITAADGEGFGLCQFEAMGIGIPQVTPDIGGFKDFCRDGLNAFTVKPKYTSYIPLSASNIGGQIEVVDPIELAIAAEKYVLDSDLRAAHGQAARQTVLAYKWEKEMVEVANVIRLI
jgi:glycosyltransferase involved in cell wall biosynthesis